ncbi:MAG: methyltransferase domain-containing protein [Oscillospiraceae bacterium]
MQESYTNFAPYYDILTSNISYPKRGEYFYSILEKLNKTSGILLDLACGTGSLCESMTTYGYDVIGVDGSSEMLTEAMNKRYESGHDIIYLCQDMQNLDLYGTIDVCICALDSINHVIEKDEVKNIFAKISLFLHPDGIFIFDVNTPYKHQKILANNTFIYDYDNVFCAWNNNLAENNIVDIHLDLFCKNKSNTYEKSTEDFSERAYSHEEILDFINSTNLELIDFYAEDSFEKPDDSTERIIYVTKSTKGKNTNE